jgi:polygalacturonase
MNRNSIIRSAGLAVLLFIAVGCSSTSSGIYNVRSHGAKGDGTTLDTSAINDAITAANSAGGGTVLFPAGTYLSYSIHLKSNVALYLDQGATILAAPSQFGNDEVADRYDPPEPNQWDKYQDFGHTHWHNSLIWGENLQNVSILGPGTIDGKGLSRGQRLSATPATRPAEEPAAMATTWPAVLPGPATQPDRNQWGANQAYPNERDRLPAGIGNKAISLKLCRNVLLRDFTIFRGGHFALLATGVDNMTIDNLRIDTNRDGLDIDCCQNVRVSNCTVNSPSDDGICPKSSFALGYARATENMTITNCQVSGYEMGSLIDGTYRRGVTRGVPTGRIKFGTESNGGFKNITISNCVFSYCRGLALESVDGALLEDVTISNITMRDITNSAFFLRLGDRARGPNQPSPGTIKRVHIDNVVVYNCNPHFSSIISGIPGHDIEDVRLSNIQIVYQGGGPKQLATSQPAEVEHDYPEPRMFGMIPAYGFYIRHVKGLEMANIKLSFMDTDYRPAFILEDVKGAEFQDIKTQKTPDVPIFVLKKVTDFSTHRVQGIADQKRDNSEDEKF